MRCKHVQERLLDARLSHGSAVPEGLLPHLERCSKCRAASELLARGARALQYIQPVAPPADLKARVFERIAQDRTKETWAERLGLFLRRPAVEWGVAAAIVFVAIGATTIVLATRGNDGAQVRALVDRGEALRLKLAERDLVSQGFVVESPRFRSTIAEAQLALDRIAGAGTDTKELTLIGEQVRSSGLAERLNQVAAAAPTKDRTLLREVIHALEQLPSN